MGWETRHGRKYLYRSRWIDGRSVKEYISADDETGLGRILAAQLEDQIRAEVELRTMARQVEAERRGRIDGLLLEAFKTNSVLQTLVDGTLYAIGYHKHHRGEWRMTRGLLDLRRQLDELREDALKPLLDYHAPANDAEAVEVFRKARDGDPQARRQVRQLIVSRGWIEWLGDLGQQATNRLIDLLAHDPVWRAGIEGKVAALYNQLIGENSTILERLLAQRIVNNWITVHHLELQLTIRPPSKPRTKEHLDRALSRAERRMAQTIGELARVRRLKLPVILARVNQVNQVNVGPQQIVEAGAV